MPEATDGRRALCKALLAPPGVLLGDFETEDEVVRIRIGDLGVANEKELFF
jgi:hypothetical protein